MVKNISNTYNLIVISILWSCSPFQMPLMRDGFRVQEVVDSGMFVIIRVILELAMLAFVKEDSDPLVQRTELDLLVTVSYPVVFYK